MNYKLRIRLPDGRSKLCGCGTRDKSRYDKMRQWVQDLKRGASRRIDVLETIVVRGVSLANAFDLRHDPDAILGLSGVRDLEPYVERWHREKAKSRKGAGSSDEYARQVRQLIPKGKAFPASSFTGLAIKRWLRGLDVQDPTRNRYKAALSSFGEFLTDEGVLERNPVRDVRGFSEGDGRSVSYELEEVKNIAERITDVDRCAAFVLAATTGIEFQVVQRLRVRDVDLVAGTLWADGGKTAWRRRLCRILFLDTKHGTVFKRAIEAAVRDKLPNTPLFSIKNDRQLLEAIAKAAEAAKLPRLTFHDQRHTFAVNALREGYKPQVVAQQLGHADTNLVWKRYGRYVVDARDYQRAGQRDGTNG